MRSPLPDSSNLEAGIVEDAVPSRLSRVHDNVRDLLRRSVFGSINGSAAPSPVLPSANRVIPSPIARTSTRAQSGPDDRPSPSETSPTSSFDNVPGVLFPPWRRRDHAEASTTSVTTTASTNSHPDLEAQAVFAFREQKRTKRQQRAWKRPKPPKRKRKSHSGRYIFCAVLALVFTGLLATYIALLTTTPTVSPLLHALFILALLFTTIVFTHSLVRHCCLQPRGRSRPRLVRIEPAPRRRRHRRYDGSAPAAAAAEAAPEHYVPATPIPVHLASDDALPEMVQVDGQSERAFGQKRQPPPAYGSNTSSVRADPELLYWQAAVSEGLPSPTYEEAVKSKCGGDGSERGREGGSEVMRESA